MGYGQASSSGGSRGSGGSGGAFTGGGLVTPSTWTGTKASFGAGGFQGFSNGAVDKGWNSGYGQADSSFGSAGLSGADSVGYDGISKTAGSFNANIPGGNTPKNTLNKNGKLKRAKALRPKFAVPPPTIQPVAAPPVEVVGPWETVPPPSMANWQPAYQSWKNPTSYPVNADSWNTNSWGSNPPQYSPASQGGGSAGMANGLGSNWNGGKGW